MNSALCLGIVAELFRRALSSRPRLRTFRHTVRRRQHSTPAVENSEITSESVSKTSERLWSRLHTAPWFRPFRSAGVLLLGKTTQGLFSVAYTALAARALGLEAFGALVLLHGFIMAVADLARFQSWQIVLRYGASALNAGDTSRFHRVLNFSVLLDLLGAGIGLVVVQLTVAPAMRLFGLPLELQALAPYYGVSILFLTSVGTSQGVLRLLGRFDLIAIQTAIAPATRLLGSAVLYLAGADLEAFLVVWFLGTVLARLTMLAFGWRELMRRELLPQRRASSEGIPSSKGMARLEREAWRFALGTSLNATLGLADKHLGLLAVGWLVGPAGAGLFRIARQLADVLTKANRNLLTPAIYPELAKLTARGDVGGRRDMVIRSALLMGVVSTMAFGVLALFGEPLIELIAGSGFEDAYGTMLLLALAGVISNCTFPLEPLLISVGRVSETVIIRGAALTTYLALIYPLLVETGAIGAGIAACTYAASGAVLFGLRGRRVISAASASDVCTG